MDSTQTGRPGPMDSTQTGQPGDAAASSLGSQPAQALSAREEAAVEKALDIVGAAPPSLAGLQDVQSLVQAAGVPAPRILFAEMAAKAGVGPPAFEHPTSLEGTGCFQADYVDPATGEARTAHLLLDECAADHDLGAQLSPLYERVAPEHHQKVRDHLSMLIYLGRTVYAHRLGAETRAVSALLEGLPAGFDPSDLRVDPANTTLYLPPPCSRRVGLFIRY